MSKTVTHFYRYRKIVSEEELKLPDFRKYLFEFEKYFKVPENTDPLFCWHTFEHEHETIKGAWVINYFEDDEDMVLYESSYMDDPSIYKEWLKREKENKLILKYKSKGVL